MNKFRTVINMLAVIALSLSLVSATAFAENIDNGQMPRLESNFYATPDEDLERQLEYSREIVQKHQRYRQANNLDSSDQAIRNALNSDNARESIMKYSIALTEEEESYIQHRDELMVKYGDQISNILKENGVKVTRGPNNELIEKYSDVGTFHQEKADGLKFVVGLVNNEKANQIQKIIEEFVPEEYLEIRQVNFSEAELVAAYEAVINESNQRRIPFETVAVRIKENVVEVQVEQYEQASQLLAGNSLKALTAEDPNIFKVVVGRSNEELKARTTKLDIMAGGLLIDDNASDSQTGNAGYCTIGTLATKNSDRFIITAGHCLASWSSTIFQGGEAVGTKHYQYNGNGADVGVLKVSSGKSISNYVYKYSWTDSRISSYQSSSSSLSVGANICLSGATTGFNCGEVTAVNITSLGNSGYMETDIVAQGGDSGGTMYYNGVLIGLLRSGDGATYSRFSHIANAKALGGDWAPYTSNSIQ
ncbi:S1 family peptidase [Paenibacillus daejeonensis]|uniref:S1 family peptidase n=1 Tax=Paenibacillus daejeonensis TaxID=135193 RepID=UPI00037450C2|nr:S1 family peptidase [Paenibacillus daejeonensis]